MVAHLARLPLQQPDSPEHHDFRRHVHQRTDQPDLLAGDVLHRRRRSARPDELAKAVFAVAAVRVSQRGVTLAPQEQNCRHELFQALRQRYEAEGTSACARRASICRYRVLRSAACSVRLVYARLLGILALLHDAVRQLNSAWTVLFSAPRI